MGWNKMKSIIISVQPEYAQKILNGKQTSLLRKSVPKDFEEIIKEQGGIWVYMCVTKAKPYITMQSKTQFTVREDNGYTNLINGKVVARWWFDEYTYYNPMYFENTGIKELDYLVPTDERIALCLDDDEINAYGKGKRIWAWHIKRLEIFDKPMELGDFYKRTYFGNEVLKYHYRDNKPEEDTLHEIYLTTLTKTPATWQYVWVTK